MYPNFLGTIIPKSTQVDPEQPLRLQDFACHTASISFVVVNKYGASRESPRLTLTVPGGMSMHTSLLQS